MGLRLVNDLDEPFVLEPGESVDFGYDGDYEVEEESMRVMSTRKETVRVTEEINDD